MCSIYDVSLVYHPAISPTRRPVCASLLSGPSFLRGMVAQSDDIFFCIAVEINIFSVCIFLSCTNLYRCLCGYTFRYTHKPALPNRGLGYWGQFFDLWWGLGDLATSISARKTKIVFYRQMGWGANCSALSTYQSVKCAAGLGGRDQCDHEQTLPSWVAESFHVSRYVI